MTKKVYSNMVTPASAKLTTLTAVGKLEISPVAEVGAWAIGLANGSLARESGSISRSRSTMTDVPGCCGGGCGGAVALGASGGAVTLGTRAVGAVPGG